MARNRQVDIIRPDNGDILVQAARWCADPLCKLRGFQFRRRLKPGEALVLVTSNSIHMLFVFFPIAAIWINADGLVTHSALAKPWRPYYASKEPAKYVLEGAPDLLESIHVGDQTAFRFLDGKRSA